MSLPDIHYNLNRLSEYLPDVGEVGADATKLLDTVRKQVDDLVTDLSDELDALIEAVGEHLPACQIEHASGDIDECNVHETVEHAGQQLDRQARQIRDLEKTIEDLKAQLPKPKTAMVAVESSNVKAVGYELDGHLLVEFKNHTTYRYKDVPAALYERLVRATSVGSLLSEEVRGRYEYERIA